MKHKQELPGLDRDHGTTHGIKSGMDHRPFIELACRLGCRVRLPRRTGEVEFRHHLMSRSLRLNHRRKDTPRIAAAWLREVERRSMHVRPAVAGRDS
jgi:hypothetical protein